MKKRLGMIVGSVVIIGLVAVLVVVFFVEPQLRANSVVGMYVEEFDPNANGRGQMELLSNGTAFFDDYGGNSPIYGSWRFAGTDTIEASHPSLNILAIRAYDIVGSNLVEEDSGDAWIRQS